jgi:hypothetical protein
MAWHHLLVRGRELAVQHEVRAVHKVAVCMRASQRLPALVSIRLRAGRTSRQLLDGVTAVLQHTGRAVDEGDLAVTAAGGGEAFARASVKVRAARATALPGS